MRFRALDYLLMVLFLATLGNAVLAQSQSPAVMASPYTSVDAPRRLMPVAYCPRTKEPPKIDGVFDDACWADAVVLDGFMLDSRDAFASQATEARLVFDDQWVYVAIRCKEDDMAHQKVYKTGRSMPWDEDCVEFFVDASRGDSVYAQYCANVLGANNLPLPAGQEDTVVVVGKAGPDEWLVEARLLIDALTKTPPKAGDVWGLNICRGRNRAQGSEGSSWARLKGSYHVPDRYGILVFCDQIPVVRATAVDIYDPYEGENVALLTLAGKPGTQVTAAMTSVGGDRREQGRIADDGSLVLGVPYKLAGGFNALSLVVTLAGQEKPVLKTDLRAASLSRPEWADYLPGYGFVAISLPHEVAQQGETLAANLQVVRQGANQDKPLVAWQLKTPDADAKPIPSDSGRFALDKGLPDGQAVLTANMTSADGKVKTTLHRPVKLAGQTLAKWQQESDQWRASLAKIHDKMTSPDLKYSLIKAQAKINRLGEFVAMRDLVRATVAAEDAAYHVASLVKGQIPVWGHHELTYTSAIDGSQQPFIVTIPKDYDPAGTDKRPTLIYLHQFIGDGYWPDEAVMYEFAGPLERAGLEKGFIVVQPYGRGSLGYRADAHTDVLDVWKIVNDRWRIDPDRVYVAGFSMGGRGTALFSSTYPHMFAAAAVCSMGMPARAMPNVRHLPMRFESGGQEQYGVTQEDLDALLKLPGRVAETIIKKHPNFGHTQDYIDYHALLDWLASYRRAADPSVVTFGADELAYASNYWVTVEAFQEYGKPITVDARIQDDQLTVTTSNVQTIRLTPPPALLPKDKPLKVVLNGQPMADVKIDNGQLLLACATRPAAGTQPVVYKTRELAGPIVDVFSRPFMLVTAGDGKQAAALNKSAQRIVDRWVRWHHGKLAPVAEQDASADLASRNIILVGSWSQDGLMAQVRRTAPVKIGEKDITVLGPQADKPRIVQAGKDLGVIFIQPNPLNPKHYIVVITGQNLAGVDAACRVFEQEQFSGDYTLTVTENERFVHGFFDGSWR